MDEYIFPFSDINNLNAEFSSDSVLSYDYFSNLNSNLLQDNDHSVWNNGLDSVGLELNRVFDTAQVLCLRDHARISDQ